MIERSLRSKRFNETKRIINSAIVFHILIALCLLLLLLLLVNTMLPKKLAITHTHDNIPASDNTVQIIQDTFWPYWFTLLVSSIGLSLTGELLLVFK